MNKLVILLLGCVALASAEIYFSETFDESYTDRWTVSNWKKSSGDAGTWGWSAGDWYGDAEADKGILTSQDARFYAISAEMDEFSNEGKTLVVQFSVKHAQKIDCGGGYIKVFPAGLDQESLSGDSEYAIMFGPDICGTSTKKVHVIFNYKGENLLTTKSISCETDQLTHVYTLIVNPDNSYEVRIDGEERASGSLFDDWDFLEPEEIQDPDVSKPSDWVDDKMMDDPEDVKPDDYDDIPKLIADPDAEKPDDWDDESDGEWDAPMIDNPEYRGPWSARRIENPDYQGPWEHPMIANPDFEADDEVYMYPSLKYVGFDLWQVKAGSIFDNVIITDSVAEAEAFMEDTYAESKAGEKAMFDTVEQARRDEEEAERKRMAEEAEDDEDEDDDWDDDEDDEEEEFKDEL